MQYLTFIVIIFLIFPHNINAQDKESSLTVMQTIELIRQNVKPHWYETKTDTIITGNGSDTVTGIATCMFVDMDILKRAVEENCNLIITHEPTFYDGNDKLHDFMKDDKVEAS